MSSTLPKMSNSNDDDHSHSVSDKSTDSIDMEQRDSAHSENKQNVKKKDYPCEKLMLPEHLAAYMEKRDLDRDVEPIKWSNETIQKIFGNYLIVKNILRHLRWQEKLICKDVCTLWSSVVNRLQLEQLRPVDFSINAGTYATREGVVLLKSSEFYTEPMAVFLFCTAMELQFCSVACKLTLPTPCSPPCDQKHSILDFIHHETTAPRDCMYGVKANNMLYLPLPHSVTAENTIEKPIQGSDANYYGMYIPKIPGVKFIIMNTTTSADNIQDELLQEIENYTVKGVVACLTENYFLYEDNAECLRFLHAIQPNTPFAFGGCLIEETINNSQDLVGIVDCVKKGIEFICGNVLSLGVFVTPKVQEGSSKSKDPNFEIYSFVLESKEWSQQDIKRAIQEFSESVPHFEHSAVLKFTCVGRQHKHVIEQNFFRDYFPHTPLVGCFGNGELGVNFPPRPPRASCASKRPKKDSTYERVYSYSTVFFYMGWGKVLQQSQRDL